MNALPMEEFSEPGLRATANEPPRHTAAWPPCWPSWCASFPSPRGLFYEPKWDGFRCIVFRDGADVVLGSRNEKPLDRYFPELIESLLANVPDRCVLDGEIVIAGPSGLDFDALSQRIHPAASRVLHLSKTTPASFVAFDLLAIGDHDLTRRAVSRPGVRVCRRRWGARTHPYT
jgi:hypothetical protein